MAKKVVIKGTQLGFDVVGDGKDLSQGQAQAAALDIAADMTGSVDIVMENVDATSREFDPAAKPFVDMRMTDKDREDAD